MDGVSVIIPTYQAGRHLDGCLDAVWAQCYRGPLEVIVADGGSSDDTRAIAERHAAAGRPVRIVDNPDRVQAAGLNRAAQAARHDLLVRCDAHARLPARALELLVHEHRRNPGANVGGVQVAVAPGRPFGDAVAAVYATTLGSGGAAYRRGAMARDVDTVYLGSWNRDDFLALGGFDPAFDVNEDAELNERWRSSGRRVRLLPDLRIAYRPRESPSALAVQYYRYGFWRARTVRAHGFARPRQLAALAPLAAVSSLVLVGLRRWSALPFGAYAGAVAATATAVPGPTRQRVLAGIALATMHLSWGMGFVAGALRPFRRDP
jgi:succinoglycan biosynthesis protein ExoA